MRGLKSETAVAWAQQALSHPTRMRGLKCSLSVNLRDVDGVASYADAWIEIGIAFSSKAGI
ncbi:hypothetical protein M5W89_00275, partial [Paenibacillus thiaminolyticus]